MPEGSGHEGGVQKQYSDNFSICASHFLNSSLHTSTNKSTTSHQILTGRNYCLCTVAKSKYNKLQGICSGSREGPALRKPNFPLIFAKEK